MVLKKKTNEAPNAVTPQVKQVANKACKTGCKPMKLSVMVLIDNIA
jgi:hypothetical protein